MNVVIQQWFDFIIEYLMKIFILLLCGVIAKACDPCYTAGRTENCADKEIGKDSYTLHMSVHPHLDAFWIFNFDSYYDPQPEQGQVRGYFSANRFTSVKQIFTTAINVLWKSKQFREGISNQAQQAHRMFFNSQMGFFKHWFVEQSSQTKKKVREVLKTKYWQILGGGFVEHDEGCAYYDDIIENFELGLHFLKEELSYFPRIAISADSFGHSQSTLAILAHLGIEGFFVERSDQHILLQNKTQFIWKAKSANGKTYGALPTHIRWAIHGFEDQFIGEDPSENFCQTKESFMQNLRGQNNFLKRILKSNHIMRYFGHDFQEFSEYSYKVIQGMMNKFSKEKCNRVVATYGNPTEYFITLMEEVFGKQIKPVVTRSEDIFPIWDYDSGLYWTGYFTSDAYHKKDYRDMGRFLRGVRKFYLPLYLAQPNSLKNKQYYQKLQELAEQVSYLQHHDGISGTSTYMVMDTLEQKNKKLYEQIDRGILGDIFAYEFPLGTDSLLFTCHIDRRCAIPREAEGDVYLKILNSDGSLERDPIIIDLPEGRYFQPDCDYEINCFCIEQDCPCKLYLYAHIATYTSLRLIEVNKEFVKANFLKAFAKTQRYSFNQTHFKIEHQGSEYSIGYKKVIAKATQRNYKHLSRYGQQSERDFSIRPGKYALGNVPATASDFSQIHQVLTLQSNHYTFFLLNWKRYGMKTLISIPASRPNQWKVETISATEGYYLQDLYFQVGTPIKNKHKFVTDSNGWLTMERELFKHQDYEAYFQEQDELNGNTYPATSFAYIKDSSNKVSVNLQRPQGVVSYREGTLWINFDRLSEDDGKWVYESAYRSEYQKYTHTITVGNKNYNQRTIQRRYDQPLFIQGNLISPSAKVESTDIDLDARNQWNAVSNIQNLKFSIRPFNDSTVILRLQNMHDEQSLNVGLFAGVHSQLLTTFYGRTVSFDSIIEKSLGANMNYGDFVNAKWNWKKVVDLTEQNKIFDKVFKENITLLPLQIRTFQLKGLKFDPKCIQTSELKYYNLEVDYKLNTEKASPTRDGLTVKIEQQVIKYMMEGNHCDGVSPVLGKQSKHVITIDIIVGGGATQKGIDNHVFTPRQTEHKVIIQTQQPSKKPAQKKPSKSSDIRAVTPSRPTLSPSETHHINLRNKQAAHTPQQAKHEPQLPRMDDKLLHLIKQKINRNQMLKADEKQSYFGNKLALAKKMTTNIK